jgi:hypothetical protein
MKALKILGWVIAFTAYTCLLVYGMRYFTVKNLEVVKPPPATEMYCSSSVVHGPVRIKNFAGKIIGYWNADDLVFCQQINSQQENTLTIITRNKSIPRYHNVTFQLGR